MFCQREQSNQNVVFTRRGEAMLRRSPTCELSPNNFVEILIKRFHLIDHFVRSPFVFVHRLLMLQDGNWEISEVYLVLPAGTGRFPGLPLLMLSGSQRESACHKPAMMPSAKDLVRGREVCVLKLFQQTHTACEGPVQRFRQLERSFHGHPWNR